MSFLWLHHQPNLPSAVMELLRIYWDQYTSIPVIHSHSDFLKDMITINMFCIGSYGCKSKTTTTKILSLTSKAKMIVVEIE